MRLVWDSSQQIGPIAQTEEGGWLLVWRDVLEGPLYAPSKPRYGFVDIEPLPVVSLRIANDLGVFDWRTDEDRPT